MHAEDTWLWLPESDAGSRAQRVQRARRRGWMLYAVGASLFLVLALGATWYATESAAILLRVVLAVGVLAAWWATGRAIRRAERPAPSKKAHMPDLTDLDVGGAWLAFAPLFDPAGGFLGVFVLPGEGGSVAPSLAASSSTLPA